MSNKTYLAGTDITTVDYDPGDGEVNQLNRIKLMLTEAKKKSNKYKNPHLALL